jgi:uncharacterized membrane protein YhaH (DUF805 family)
LNDTRPTSRLNFLYRGSEGTIDRREWALASLPLVAILIVFTLIWIAIMPREARDPSKGLVDVGVAMRYMYLVVYAFVVLVCAVAQYFVSAKRFADLGKPPALAGVAPFAVFIAAASNWYEPRSEGLNPHWLSLLFDVLALAAVAWNIVELGFLKRNHSS